MESESELVARLCDGDEHAFVTLVQQYQMPMLRLARSMVDNDAVAEEAVQDTWMSVVKGIERFEARSSLKTWLFRILVNRVRSAYAGERRRRPNRAPSVDPAFFDSSGQWVQPVVPWDDDVDDRVVAASIGPAPRRHSTGCRLGSVPWYCFATLRVSQRRSERRPRAPLRQPEGPPPSRPSWAA